MRKNVVLGNSVQALVAAAYLSKSTTATDPDSIVTVVEPYSSHSAWSQTLSLDPQVESDLGLSFESQILSHRYAYHHANSTWVRASKAGLEGDITKKDQERWPEFVALLDQASLLMRQSYLLASDPATQFPVAESWRALPAGQAREVMRLPWISLKDLLNEWFDSDVLKGLLAQIGLQQALQGPFASGTGLGLLHAWATGQALERRVTPDLESHLRAHLQAHQVEFLPADPKRLQVLVQDERVIGVHTGSQELSCQALWSSLDAKRSLGWVSRRYLEHETVAAVNQMRYRGCTALAYGDKSALPDLPNCSGADWTAGVVLTDGLNGLEKAYDPTKYGRHSQSLIGQFQEHPSGWCGQIGYHPYQQSSRQTVLQLLAERGFAQVLTCYLPEDLEFEFGYSQGSLTGEQLILSQCHFMRPFAHYRAGENPFLGLHFCGPSVHPGDFGGLCARLAATGAAPSRQPA